MYSTFEKRINENYIYALKNQHILKPTEIQGKVIQYIMDGFDVAGVSKTGTGKTLAYLLPLMSSVDMGVKSPQVVVLTPTHELSAQVFEQCKFLQKNHPDGASAILVIGGANINRQLEALKKKPQIVVGSAGRILELVKIKKLSLHYVKTIVIDEADRMLDMHNIDQLNAVIKGTLRDRQLLFFSASMDDNVIEKAKKISSELVIVKADQSCQLPSSIQHIYFVCEQRDKIEILRKVVHGENIQKCLVFMNNPNDIENMAKRLNYHGLNTATLFGSNFPKERRQALLDFKENRVKLLLASDIAARGLDINGLDYVVNLDVPENPVFYLHRAGRTGRMGKVGNVLSIAANKEVPFIKMFEKKYSISINLKKVKFGNIID